MINPTNLIQKLLFLLLLSGIMAPGLVKAQCPSVVGTGEPAILFLTVYGAPHGHYFAFEQEETKFGMAGGLNIGAILSEGFHLQSGVELSSVKRSIDRPTVSADPQTYKTFFIEIPLEMRARFYEGNHGQNQAFFTLGAGVMLSNVKETNDPTITRNEVQYHQLFARIGFEHAITVANKFNILWGLNGKADPFALADDTYSYLNGSYYAGAKIGLQLGF